MLNRFLFRYHPPPLASNLIAGWIFLLNGLFFVLVYRYDEYNSILCWFFFSLATRASPSQKEFSLVRRNDETEIKSKNCFVFFKIKHTHSFHNRWFLMNRADVLDNVNKSALDVHSSRLFAVVQLAGSQFKVTTEDVITVRGAFYPTIGDRIRLEKVGHFFTLLL